MANYSAPLNVLSGLSQIQSVLEENLAPVTTQHSLGTQVIELLEAEDEEVGGYEARAVTYYTATHFGMGPYEGAVSGTGFLLTHVHFTLS